MFYLQAEGNRMIIDFEEIEEVMVTDDGDLLELELSLDHLEFVKKTSNNLFLYKVTMQFKDYYYSCKDDVHSEYERYQKDLKEHQEEIGDWMHDFKSAGYDIHAM